MSHDEVIAKAKKAIENARKTLVQQQTEVGPADPAALAEMQVKNLDKFAKKLKKQYKDALDQNTDAKKELVFIDEKLKYLEGKCKVVTENLTMRRNEYNRMSAKLEECEKIQNDLMGDVKGRVEANHHDMSRTSKKYAREVKELSCGFSIMPGTTCTVNETLFRTKQLKKISEERNALVEKMRASGVLGASLSDMQKLMSVGGGGTLSLSESMKSLPSLKYNGPISGGGKSHSASTSAL